MSAIALICFITFVGFVGAYALTEWAAAHRFPEQRRNREQLMDSDLPPWALNEDTR